MMKLHDSPTAPAQKNRLDRKGTPWELRKFGKGTL